MMRMGMRNEICLTYYWKCVKRGIIYTDLFTVDANHCDIRAKQYSKVNLIKSSKLYLSLK